MNTQPTPETDSEEIIITKGKPTHWVSQEFARRLERERDEWKAKYIQQNKDLGCELRDPNGTIWDHAKTLQRERDEARGQANDMREKWLAKGQCCEHLGAELHEATRERDEARDALAEIEDKMRVELGGHPDSELWGGSGLIAATMRCVDALGEVTDQRDDARAEMIRWMSIAEGAESRGFRKAWVELDDKRQDLEKQLATITAQRDRLAEAIREYTSGNHPESFLLKALQSLTPKP
jgi:hypothetical protein